MKLSISWIFDHINSDWRKQDIDLIVSQFNKISGEIEDFYEVKVNLDKFAIAKVISEHGNNLKVSIPEWKKEIELPKREDGMLFFVTNEFVTDLSGSNKDDKICWSTLNDFNLSKDGLMPSIDIEEKDLNGDWK